MTTISCWETPAWTISTNSPGLTPSKAKENVSVVTPFASAGAVIHCAAPKSSSGRVAAFGPIHFACQSSGRSTPIVNVAGADQSEARPASSQVRTRHATRCEEASAPPGQATFRLLSDATRPWGFPSSSSS